MTDNAPVDPDDDTLTSEEQELVAGGGEGIALMSGDGIALLDGTAS